MPCAFSADVFGAALRGNACHDFCIFGSRSGTVSGATFRHQKLVSLSVHMAAPYWGELHRYRKVGSFFVSEHGLGFGVGKRHRGNRNPGWLCGPPVSNFIPLPTHLSAAAAHRHRRRSAPRFCKVGASWQWFIHMVSTVPAYRLLRASIDESLAQLVHQGKGTLIRPKSCGAHGHGWSLV